MHVRPFLAPRIQRALTVAITLALLACLQAQAAAESLLWKVTSPAGRAIYLAGSVHLLTPDYYPLAPAFDAAFQQSDLLVEELDLREVLAPDSQMQPLMRGMLPAGQLLDQVVSPATMAAVESQFAQLGMPLGPMKQFKPWLLALTLEALEWQKAGFDADLGLDKHFFDLASARGLTVQGLETMEFQVSKFDEMSMPLQDRFLAETLKELATATASVTELAEAWKRGNAGRLETLVLQDLKSDPDMYQRLLVDRNRAWMPAIESLFSRPKPAFVVVGAAHVVGPDGLLATLKAKGYTIEQR